MTITTTPEEADLFKEIEIDTVAGVLRSPAVLVRETLAGLVTALALIPEVISFSFITGVDPKTALIASVVLGLVMSVLGGRTAMVTAAAGSIALVVGPMVKVHGVGYILPAIILAGVIQIAFGAGRPRAADALRSPLGDDRFCECARHSDLCSAGASRPQRALAGLSAVRAVGGDHPDHAALHRGGAGAAGGDRRRHRDRHDRSPRGAECRRRGIDGAGAARRHADAGSAQPRNPADHLADRAQRRLRRPAGNAADRQAGRRPHRHQVEQGPRILGARALPTSPPASTAASPAAP